MRKCVELSRTSSSDPMQISDLLGLRPTVNPRLGSLGLDDRRNAIHVDMLLSSSCREVSRRICCGDRICCQLHGPTYCRGSGMKDAKHIALVLVTEYGFDFIPSGF